MLLSSIFILTSCISTNPDLSLPSYYHTQNPLYIFSHKNPSHHNSCKGFDNVYKDILMRRIFCLLLLNSSLCCHRYIAPIISYPHSHIHVRPLVDSPAGRKAVDILLCIVDRQRKSWKLPFPLFNPTANQDNRKHSEHNHSGNP